MSNSEIDEAPGFPEFCDFLLDVMSQDYMQGQKLPSGSAILRAYLVEMLEPSTLTDLDALAQCYRHYQSEKRSGIEKPPILQELARFAAHLVQRTIEDGKFEDIKKIAEILMGEGYCSPAPATNSHKEIWYGIADFYDERGRLPGTQEELRSYLEERGMPHSKSTVSDALRILRFPIKGKQGRRPK